MPAILTLDYSYTPVDQPWFSKTFGTYADLLKWLREDSIIVIESAKLTDEKLNKKLILTKLALPRVTILVIYKEDKPDNSSFFNNILESELEELIHKALINQHKIIDNRENLKEVLELFS